MFVGAIRVCAMHEQREHDRSVPIRTGEMKGRRSRGTDDRR